MKKNIKSLLCIVMAFAIICCTSAFQVFAAVENSEGSSASDYSTESNMTPHSDFLEESKTYSVDVYASQASGSDYYDEDGNLVEGDIIVWIPTEATLEKQESGEYKCTVPVKVQGNIAGNEKVSVVPDSTITLTQPGKADVTGTVTQLKTEFTYEDLKDGTVAQTTTDISVTGLSAGEWTGRYSYAVSLVEV